MSDVKPSIRRTPTQAVLRIVSIIMLILGGLTLAGGIVAIVAGNALGLASGDLWTSITFGVIILVAAGLLILTAVLGLAASNDSVNVGRYRFLCYLVGLAVLVAIVWGWGLGTFILFNPLVLVTTIVYVLICSTLADKVKEEHDAGVRGETFLRSRHQRTLHLLSEVIVLKGALTGVVVAVVAVALISSGEGGRITLSGISMTLDQSLLPQLAATAVSAAVDLVAGGLGIWGSNRPEKIRPFLVLAVLALVIDVAQVAGSIVEHGGIGGLAFDLILDLLFMGACAWMSVRILRQPPLPELVENSATAVSQ